MLWHPWTTDDGSAVGLRAERADAALTIGTPLRPFDDPVTEPPWTLTRSDDLTCAVIAYTMCDEGLSAFIDEAARDFRGWNGERYLARPGERRADRHESGPRSCRAHADPPPHS
jgi:hypothetical protein